MRNQRSGGETSETRVRYTICLNIAECSAALSVFARPQFEDFLPFMSLTTLYGKRIIWGMKICQICGQKIEVGQKFLFLDNDAPVHYPKCPCPFCFFGEIKNGLCTRCDGTDAVRS